MVAFLVSLPVPFTMTAASNSLASIDRLSSPQILVETVVGAHMQGIVSDTSVVFACVSNNDAILTENLLRSPVLASSGARIHVERGAPSASIGYNRALDATDEDLIVFLHHDVYLPHGWENLLLRRVREVAERDPDWAVIGAFGVGLDGTGYGPVWSTSLGHIVGKVPSAPMPVQSFDEMLFVLRRKAGLRFDEGLKGFHFYGTDIVHAATSRGLKSYATPLPCVHNDKFKEVLDDDFRRTYHYMRRKWRAHLPVSTPIVKIAWHGLNMVRLDMRNSRDKSVRHGMSQSVQTDPQTYADRCGWNSLSPCQE